MRVSSSVASLRPAGILLTAALAGFGWGGATTIHAGNGDPAQDTAALKQQIAALERRVAELEKVKGVAAGGRGEPAGADARLAKLEARMNAVEKRDAAESSSQPAAAAPTSFTAPFTIFDSAGKMLMRVTEDGNGFSRGLYVYDSDEKGAAHVGAMPGGGGRLYATAAGGLPMVNLSASTAGGGRLQIGANAKVAVTLDRNSLTFLTDGGTGLSSFGTKDRGKGYLELNDGSGSKMIEAGSLQGGKGYVLASPYRPSTAPTGNPSVLMGGAGR